MITLIPFLFWIYLAVCLFFFVAFGVQGLVITVICLVLLASGMGMRS